MLISERLLVPRDKVFDVPAYMWQDEVMKMRAEAALGSTRPTQDLMAKDRDGNGG